MESNIINAIVRITETHHEILIIDKVRGISKRYDHITVYIGIDEKGKVYNFGYHDIYEVVSFGNSTDSFIKKEA